MICERYRYIWNNLDKAVGYAECFTGLNKFVTDCKGTARFPPYYSLENLISGLTEPASTFLYNLGIYPLGETINAVIRVGLGIGGVLLTARAVRGWVRAYGAYRRSYLDGEGVNEKPTS